MSRSEDDGLARIIPPGESGRAHASTRGGVGEVARTADDIVLRVGLEFLDAFGDLDVRELLLKLFDLSSLLLHAEAELAVALTVGVDAFDVGQSLLDLLVALHVERLRFRGHRGRREERAAEAERRSGGQGE
ncbi:Uncharacterised protein [Mycobacteroides abscessus subsp. abscessus]|nr:Uncharacterised protein [Mycobacteroides abscessus subsp. abscessus]